MLTLVCTSILTSMITLAQKTARRPAIFMMRSEFRITKPEPASNFEERAITKR